MSKDYANKNLQKASFKDDVLNNLIFAGSDLRGADFSGADLTGSDLTNVKTGITPLTRLVLFIVAMIISALSGYFAMLAGQMIQAMYASDDKYVRIAAVTAVIMILLFIAYALWRGGGKAIRYLVIPAIILSLILGGIAYFTGVGTGKGLLFLVFSFLLVIIMFITGTAARAAAGSLSNIFFVIVALGGGLFSKTIGGGIGTFIVAISCALISKRALSGAKGFEGLRKITTMITVKFGTSFRGAKLMNTHFSGAKLTNADFRDADITQTDWGNSKRINCLT